MVRACCAEGLSARTRTRDTHNPTGRSFMPKVCSAIARLIVAAALLIAFGTGCAHRKRCLPEDKLANALKFYEIIEKDGDLELRASGQDTPIDYRSRLKIIPDPQKLAEAAKPAPLSAADR